MIPQTTIHQTNTSSNGMSMTSPGHIQIPEIRGNTITPISQLSQLTHKGDALRSDPFYESIYGPTPVLSKDGLTGEQISINKMIDNFTSFLLAELKVFSEILPLGRLLKLRGYITRVSKSIATLKYSAGDPFFKLISNRTKFMEKAQLLQNTSPKKRPSRKTTGSPPKAKKRLRDVRIERKVHVSITPVPSSRNRSPKNVNETCGSIIKHIMRNAGNNVHNTPPCLPGTTLNNTHSMDNILISNVLGNFRHDLHDTPTHVLSNVPIKVPDKDSNVATAGTSNHYPVKACTPEIIDVEMIDTSDVNLYDGQPLIIDIKDDEL